MRGLIIKSAGILSVISSFIFILVSSGTSQVVIREVECVLDDSFAVEIQAMSETKDETTEGDLSTAVLTSELQKNISNKTDLYAMASENSFVGQQTLQSTKTKEDNINVIQLRQNAYKLAPNTMDQKAITQIAFNYSLFESYNELPPI